MYEELFTDFNYQQEKDLYFFQYIRISFILQINADVHVVDLKYWIFSQGFNENKQNKLKEGLFLSRFIHGEDESKKNFKHFRTTSRLSLKGGSLKGGSLKGSITMFLS